MYLKKLSLIGLLITANSYAISLADEPLKPLPKAPKIEQIKIQLGDKLFHDTRLSKDNTISCASCHDLSKGGTDQSTVSTGIKGQQGEINSPTVYNSRHNFVQFWDGRAKSLEEQAEGPVANPIEMGHDWSQLVKVIQSDPEYVKLFKEAYGGEIDKKTITRAIADFERSLDTPSRFDDYLRGNEKALSAQEKKGYELFKHYGCIACHNGVNVGGGMFQKMGLVHDYFKDRGHVTKADLGRYNVTGNEADKHYFKVPTLRNVELTAPYFHDASEKDLKTVVQKMGYYQLGLKIPDNDAEDIVAFLKSLTGKSLKKSRQ